MIAENTNCNACDVDKPARLPHLHIDMTANQIDTLPLLEALKAAILIHAEPGADISISTDREDYFGDPNKGLLTWEGGPYDWTMISAGSSLFGGTKGDYALPREPEIEAAFQAIEAKGLFVECVTAFQLSLHLIHQGNYQDHDYEARVQAPEAMTLASTGHELGKTYRSLYWQENYTVTEISHGGTCDSVRVQWEDGHFTRHSTMRDKDPIVSPTAAK